MRVILTPTSAITFPTDLLFDVTLKNPFFVCKLAAVRYHPN